MRILFAILILFASSVTQAGYYAVIDGYEPDMQYTNFYGASASGCFLLPSMAIASLAGGAQYYVVDALDSSGNWSVKGTTAQGGRAWGRFAQCDAAPSVVSIPQFAGGVSDPSVVGGSVISGNGSTGGSGYSDSTIAALQAEVAALQSANTMISAELGRIGAIQNEPFDWSTALGGMAFSFSTVLFFFGISRGIGEVLSVIRRY